MTTSTFRQDQGGPRLNVGRLWAGGVATAIVAALIVVVGVCVSSGIFGVAVPVPTPTGAMSAVEYVVLAGVAAIAATGLLHLLIMATPRPLVFFGWMIFLATVVAVVAPFMNSLVGSFDHIALLSNKGATSAINLVAGVAIGSLLFGVARGAVAVPPRPPRPGGYPYSYPSDPFDRSGYPGERSRYPDERDAYQAGRDRYPVDRDGYPPTRADLAVTHGA